MLDSILGNQAIIVLPFVIVVHFLIGVIASIKAKKFDIKQMPDFIVKAVMFMGFLLLLDYVNNMFTTSNMGVVALTGIQTLRGLAWLAVIVYYLVKIYKNLVFLGMPKMKKVEEELNNNQTITDDTSKIFCVDKNKEGK